MGLASCARKGAEGQFSAQSEWQPAHLQAQHGMVPGDWTQQNVCQSHLTG